MQFLGFLRLALGQILRLAEVVAEIVEFELPVLEELDQLPVADADRAGRRRAPGPRPAPEVAGEVPVDRVAVELRLAVAGQAGRR